MTENIILTQAVATAGIGTNQASQFSMFVPMILIFAIFYFMLIRPQQRKEKERRNLINELKTGAKIVFSGGIIGTVTNVKPETFVVKIADKVKVEILKGSVARIVEKGEKIGEEE